MGEPDRLLARRRLFIFDLDGTLADTSPIHADAFSAALGPRGVEVDYASVAGLTTLAAMEVLLARAGQHATQAEMAVLVAAKRSAARNRLADVREIAGASAFVALAAERHRLALCTSAARITAKATLGALGLSDRFDPMVTGDDIVEGKPSPQGFLAVLEQAGMEPADALVFEDSDAGLAAAGAAGIAAVRIGDGGSNWHALTASLAGVTA
jgi:sugar-phosphatase